MKYIISEEQHHNLRLSRRLHNIDKLVSYYQKDFERICDHSFENYLEAVSYAVSEDMYWSYFSDLDDSSEEWGHMFNRILKYIQDKFYDYLREYYDNECKDF